MSNFVVGIGGSGAKVMQALIHLGAAGMMPAGRTNLTGLLVDPDESNGNVEECLTLQEAYQACRNQVHVGNAGLFQTDLSLEGPWSPLAKGSGDSLKEIFHYNQLTAGDSAETQLMDLFFERAELDLSLKQGFRGRPAIGSAVFANSVQFGQPGPWKTFRGAIKGSSTSAAPRILFTGSVFGGSGASGVPTLSRLLFNDVKDDVNNADFGLILLLPYFQFPRVENEPVQADPISFPMAAAEALKYYEGSRFLDLCRSIYALGEEIPAQMWVSAVGAREQRNEAHFIELVAGMGAIRFFDDRYSKANGLAVAARNKDSTVTWDDLPTDPDMKQQDILKVQAKLQSLTRFAVAYHYIFYPEIQEALQAPQSAKKAYWVELVVRKDVDLQEARAPFAAVDAYAVLFLNWLLDVCTPRRAGFSAGLVDPNVFATQQGRDWTLKLQRHFVKESIKGLLLNRPGSGIGYDDLDNRVSRVHIKDKGAQGAGWLVRAIYEACSVN